MIPKTYKGRRLPQFLIKQILEDDKKKIERKEKNNSNLVTGERLIFRKETVAQFIDRISDISKKSQK